MSVLDLPRCPTSAERATRPDTLQSVGSALDVLDCFLTTPELGVSEIARRLGVAKSSAHRLLTTLASRHIVEKNPATGQYRLGVHLFALGHLAQSRVRLSSIAMPEMQRLHEATGQAVFVGLLDGEEALYPHFVGNAAVSAQLNREAIRRPAHASALGRAVAAVDTEVARRLRAQARASGPDSARAVAEFDHEIELFRRHGVATARNTVARGLSALAAPVRSFDGTVVGALVIAGPSANLAPNVNRLARILPPAAARVSRLVGAG